MKNPMNTLLRVLLVALLTVTFTACAASKEQVKTDAKDAFDRNSSQFEADQAARTALAAASMTACAQDANPGLCAVSVNLVYGLNKPAMPRLEPKPIHPGWALASQGLGFLNNISGAYFGYKGQQESNKMWTSITGTIGANAGTHVGGNFINGNQDNHVDNSLNAGGNIGDTFGYGDNYTSGTRTDNSGTLVTGDANVFGDRNNNSGRQDSPGEFIDSGNCVPTTTNTGGESGSSNGTETGNTGTAGPGTGTTNCNAGAGH